VLIRSLAAVGLVTDVQLLPRNAESFRIRKREIAAEPAAA
jgi:hypothetical protein